MEKFGFVSTRPTALVSKRGQTGKPVDLTSNYFRLESSSKMTIFQYHVAFEPEIESTALRKGIVKEYGGFGANLYDGNLLFTCTKVRQDERVMNVASKRGDHFKVTIKYVGSISTFDWQALQVFNIIMRKAMSGLQLRQIGRNFFDSNAENKDKGLAEHRIKLWPGYLTSIRQHESGILLCVELTHKVMRTETLLDILYRCKNGSGDYKVNYQREVLGTTVHTPCNNRTYRINKVDFTQNPCSTFAKKTGEHISFEDYYASRYNRVIRDRTQPLLVSEGRSEGKKDSSKLVLLIPELCCATGLTDDMAKNFQLMRAMAQHTRINPKERVEHLLKFNKRLQKSDAGAKVFSDWNLTLDSKPVVVPGRVLPPQTIVFNGAKKSAGDYADWTNCFRSSQLLARPQTGLKRWVAVVGRKNSDGLTALVDGLKRVGRGMGLDIANPIQIMVLEDERQGSFVNAVEKAASTQDPQIILILVPNTNAERYSAIKKYACLVRGIPTQIITAKSVLNERSLLSIATKVAIQMNCKIGYSPWMVELPLSALMVVGFDIAKSAKDRLKAYCALVASMDLTKNTTFYSTAAECSAHDVAANNLWPMMVKALRQYRMEHKILPTRIVLYRDGVSSGSISTVYNVEVKDFIAKCRAEYAKAQAAEPMIAYILVSKAINTRFSANDRNPAPGTVVDDVITLPERFDFYLVSQAVRQGTVAPTSYHVLYSNTRLTPDQLQQLTYKVCHLYYNWAGTTRVPAVCQYAKKLATLVGSSLYAPAKSCLEKKLFYL